MSLKIVEGDLFKYVVEHKIEVVAQGVNAQCLQGAGIAPLFVKYFRTDEFEYEGKRFRGFYNKMGIIQWYHMYYEDTLLNTKFASELEDKDKEKLNRITVVNAYTQFDPGANAELVWLIACLKKINYDFKNKTVALPLIGGGIGGIKPESVVKSMQSTLTDVDARLILLPEMYNKLKNIL